MLPVVSAPDLDVCAGACPNTTNVNDATRYLSGLLLGGLGRPINQKSRLGLAAPPSALEYNGANVTADLTTGSVHTAKVMDNLIREDDRAIYGDKGYVNDKKGELAKAAGVR